MSRARPGRVRSARVALAFALVGASTATGASAAVGASPEPAVLVSSTSDGGASTGPTGYTYFTEQTSISADGTLVAFSSEATNLVPGDTNKVADIFVKNLATGAITRVNTSATGEQALRGDSSDPDISADGTTVAFSSYAGNLVPNDTRPHSDVFVKNLATGAITRVSTRASGRQSEGHSYSPSLSADGSKVAFDSEAADLVPGDTNAQPDVFVKDVGTGAIVRASVTKSGAQGKGYDSNSEEDDPGPWGYSIGPSLSADGTKVAFTSIGKLAAADLNKDQEDVFVKNLTTGDVAVASAFTPPTNGYRWPSVAASLSADGTTVAFESEVPLFAPDDTNKTTDVFVRTLATGALVRASSTPAGIQGNQGSAAPSLSADGSKVAFYSRSSNFVPGDTNGNSDIFVKDLGTGGVVRATTGAGATEPNKGSRAPALAPGGGHVAFQSDATNLIAGDTNGRTDQFAVTL